MNERVTKTENKVLQLEEKKRKIENDLIKEKAKLKEQKRKARTRTLIEIGGLAEKAGIIEIDRGALLGAMVQIAELLKDEPTFQALKKQGDTLLHNKT